MNKFELALSRGYFINKRGNVYGPKGLRKPNLQNGYYEVRIQHKRKRHTIKYHQFQAYMKYKTLPSLKLNVRHLDGNKLNNSWSNIAIGTPHENRMDIPKKQRIKLASNPKYNHSNIIKDREKNMTYSQLMNRYNIPSKGTISFILNKSLAINRISSPSRISASKTEELSASLRSCAK